MASRVVTALLCAGVVLAPQVVGASPATITLASGGGAVGTADPATPMSFDGGVTFQPALIIAPHPAYSVIPGTQYVSDASRGSARQQTTTLFRTTFTLPEGFQDPSITVQVHADNAVRVVLNGTQIGAQPNAEIPPNFQDPAESYTAGGPFVAGVNTLDFFVRNFSGPMGLDYKAVITYATNEPPSLGLPADMTVNATSPAGATVSYSVTATDDNDPSPEVVAPRPPGPSSPSARRSCPARRPTTAASPTAAASRSPSSERRGNWVTCWRPSTASARARACPPRSAAPRPPGQG